MWLFYYFNFKRNYDILKSKSPCFLLNKNMNFNKSKTKSKMEYLTQTLEWRTLRFSSYKNRELKVKLWWVEARERKKRAFFVALILSEEIIFNVCVLSQCILYWIELYYIVLNFQNIHPFTYQKALLFIHLLACF